VIKVACGGGFDQQLADFGGGRRVERGGRFVGQNQARALHQQAGNRHFLPFAAGELVGAGLGAGQQTDRLQRRFGPATSCAGKQRVQLRQPVTRPRLPISTFSRAESRATRCKPCIT
jgi:hypothetical protein